MVAVLGCRLSGPRPHYLTLLLDRETLDFDPLYSIEFIRVFMLNY